MLKPELEMMDGLGWGSTAEMEIMDTHFKTIRDLSL